MYKSVRLLIIAAALLAIGCSKQSDIEIDSAFIPAAPPGSGVMVGYAKLKNNSNSDYRLTAANSASFTAVEFHSMNTIGGMMRMRRLDAIEIPAGDTVLLQRGGKHLMLFEPQQTLGLGDTVLIELSLESAEGEALGLTVSFPINPAK